MKRKLLLSFIIALSALSLHAQPAGWLYNQEIIATNSNGTALYGYQLPIIINTQALIEQGKLNLDGSDLRFGTPCTGAKLFDYYIDTGLNTTATLVWVKIDTMLAHSSVDFYMFYGNTNATSVSTINIFDLKNTANQSTDWEYDDAPYLGEAAGIYFTVDAPIFVKSLGRYTPDAGSPKAYLYNYTTGTPMVSVQVPGPGQTYNYAPLSSIIRLNPGTSYLMYVFLPASMDYYVNYDAAPTFNAPIHYFGPAEACCSSSPMVPYADNNPNAYYGFADMEFYAPATAPIAPTYVFGTQNGPGFSVQPASTFHICPNGSGSITAQSSGNNPTYVWQVNTGNGWTNLSNNSNYSGVHTSTLSFSNIPTSMSGYQYRANVTSGCGSGYSNVSTLNVPSSYVPPFASIYGPNPACQYINSYYGVYTNIANPSYQWSLNGMIVSTDSFYAYQPSSGDQLYCLLTVPSGSTGCYTTPQAVTNQVTITTGTNLLPHDSVASNANNVCASTQVNLRCYTDVMGGSFQWKVNGANVGTNSPNYAYLPADGDQVSCVITTPANGCYSLNSATSQPVVMSVISNINPIFSIDAAANYNPGDIVTLYASVLNAGNDYKIAWLINGQFADSTHNQTTYQYIKGNGDDYITAVLVPLSTPEMGTCYSAVGSNSITIGIATGINTVNNNTDLKVYPNPFNEEISVNGLKQGDKVCIYDVVGRRVSETWNVNSNDKQTFNIKGLVPGTYFLHVTNEIGNTKANISIQKL